jgi:hypothetical protein
MTLFGDEAIECGTTNTVAVDAAIVTTMMPSVTPCSMSNIASSASDASVAWVMYGRTRPLMWDLSNAAGVCG